MGVFFLLLGASIYATASLMYISRVFRDQKVVALILLLFPPFIFIHFILQRFKFGLLVSLQVLGLVALCAGTVSEYSEEVVAFTGIDLPSLIYDEPVTHSVLRTAKPRLSAPKLTPKLRIKNSNADSSTQIRPVDVNIGEQATDVPAGMDGGRTEQVRQVELLDPGLQNPTTSPEVIGLEASGGRALNEKPLPRVLPIPESNDSGATWEDDEESYSFGEDDDGKLDSIRAHNESNESNESGVAAVNLPAAFIPEVLPGIPQSGVSETFITVNGESTLPNADREVEQIGGEEQPEANVLDEAENAPEIQVRELPFHIIEERRKIKEAQHVLEELADSLASLVGKRVVVERENGKEENGVLSKISNEELLLEKRIGKGVMESYIKLKDVKAVRKSP